MSLVLHFSRKVRVRGTREVGNRFVVLRALIGIPDDGGERRAAGNAVDHAAEDFRRVGFLSLRGELSARGAPGHEGLQGGDRD